MALTNAQMIPGRWRRRYLVARMHRHIARGGRVQISTHTRSSLVKDAAALRAGARHIELRRGREWVALLSTVDIRLA